MFEISIIFIFCSLAVIFLVRNFIQSRNERDLKQKVAWVVTGNAGDRYSPLWVHVANAQSELKIPHQYCILGDEKEAEWQIVCKILEEFKRDLSRTFFNDHIKIIKEQRKMRAEEYFFLSLCTFLVDHHCDYHFLDNKMHRETLAYKEYSRWGTTLFDATYSLTDFAVVYHKLLYITYLLYKKSARINPNGEYFSKENVYKEILDSRQISISQV